MEERVKEHCSRIKEYLNQKEFEKAFQLWNEAVELNSYVGLKEEGAFLSGLARDVREWKRNLMANLFKF